MEKNLIELLIIPIGALFSTGVLWCVIKFMREECEFKYLFLASIIATLLAKIPYIGLLISFVVLSILVSKWGAIGMLKSFLIVFISFIIMSIIVFLILMGLNFLPIFQVGK